MGEIGEFEDTALKQPRASAGGLRGGREVRGGNGAAAEQMEI